MYSINEKTNINVYNIKRKLLTLPKREKENEDKGPPNIIENKKTVQQKVHPNSKIISL